MLMKTTVFRQYDIRGIVDSELVINEVYQLTRAIIYYAHTQGITIKTVAVGMDGRTHSPYIRDQLVQALKDHGCNIQFLGICSSPVLYFHMFMYPLDLGLMITASHNPASYNGIKIMLGRRSLWGDEIIRIADCYYEKKQLPACFSGTYQEIDGVGNYIEYYAEQFKDLYGAYVPIIVDCANGATGTLLPRLINRMKWKQIEVIHADIDGNFSHHEADPTVLENMQEVIDWLAEKKDFVCGIGFDGDGDRIGVVTSDGYLIPGDKLLGILALPILEKNPQATVVVDVKCSSAVQALLKSQSAYIEMSPCGHAIIKERLQQTKAIIAGELSGHICFADRNFGYDDGVYAFMRLIELLLSSNQTLESMLTLFPITYVSPEWRIEYQESQRTYIMDHLATKIKSLDATDLCSIDGFRIVFPFGWCLIRPSNTQPVFSIRCESTDEQGFLQIKKIAYDLLKDYVSQKTLW